MEYVAILVGFIGGAVGFAATWKIQPFFIPAFEAASSSPAKLFFKRLMWSAGVGFIAFAISGGLVMPKQEEAAKNNKQSPAITAKGADAPSSSNAPQFNGQEHSVSKAKAQDISPIASPSDLPQHSGTHGTDNFTAKCRAYRIDTAMQLGGMGKDEASGYAISACAEELPKFNECMKNPAAVKEDCFWEVVQTSE